MKPAAAENKLVFVYYLLYRYSSIIYYLVNVNYIVIMFKPNKIIYVQKKKHTDCKCSQNFFSLRNVSFHISLGVQNMHT